jgi:hypothetical protein
MEVAVMSLSAREKHALDSIESWLAGSDPGLASMLDTFTRLTSGEVMPVREKVRPRPRRNSQGRRTGRRPRPLAHPLGRQHVAVLVWLVISIAMVATALAVGRSGGGARGACAVSLTAACGRPAPTDQPGRSAQGFVPGAQRSAIWLR